MALKNLTERAKDLVPWNWGKRPVRVRNERREPFSAIREDFHRMFESFFDEFFGRRFSDRWLAPMTEPTSLLETGWPRVDLEETDTQFKVTAEVPGMEAEDIDVTIGDRSLTIQGSKTTEREQRKKNYHVMETYSGSFRRTIPLPVEIDTDHVEARCKNGQLTITLPKTQAARASAKKIEVKQD